MKTALKWYLLVGALLFIAIAYTSLTVPAISNESLALNVLCKWFGKFYTAGSVVCAVGFIAVLERGEK